jgi:hypothetical protein
MSPISRESVLTLRFMAGVAYVASPIPRLVSLEVVEALSAALGQRSSVTVMRIKAVVDMAEKPVRTVKPRACSEKHPANKPIGPIVAVRSTVIRRVIEVPVRTHGRHSDVYANLNLSLRHRGKAQKGNSESCKSKRTDFEHGSSLICLELDLSRAGFVSEFNSFRVSTWATEGQHNTQGSVPASRPAETDLAFWEFWVDYEQT